MILNNLYIYIYCININIQIITLLFIKIYLYIYIFTYLNKLMPQQNEQLQGIDYLYLIF